MNLQPTLALFRTSRALLLGLAACLGLAALLVWLAPQEQTLGNGIKVVYVHVALVWTGLTALALTGLLGAALLITGQGRLARWAQSAGWVGCAFFAAGLLMSGVAARVNWGGGFWLEPRTVASLRALAVAVIAVGAAGWLQGRRWPGLLYMLPAAFMGWVVPATPLVLHPQNAVWSSPSLGIQGTFVGLFAIFGLAALALVIYFTRPGPTAG